MTRNRCCAVNCHQFTTDEHVDRHIVDGVLVLEFRLHFCASHSVLYDAMMNNIEAALHDHNKAVSVSATEERYG